MRRCPTCAAALGSTGWTCAACGWRAADRDGFPDLGGDGGREGFAEDSFERLEAVEDRSFWFRARNELVGWALAAFAPDAQSFLEIGCGTGYVLQGLAARMPRLRLTGGDPYAAGLRIARDRVPGAELLLLDGRTLPFRDEFDAAGAFDVLEHIEDDEAVISAMRAALRPRGILLVTVPQHPWLWSPVDEVGHHVRRYRREELRRRLERGGLELLRMTSFVSLLLPLVAASRLRQRRHGADVDADAEFRIDPRVDRALERVLALEQALIRRGASLPAGSSLLAVARRPS